jgi:high affinity Mn2+ porin
LAFVTNAISRGHQTYLADGGFGFLIGDGALNYSRENIVETYYTAESLVALTIGDDQSRDVHFGTNPRELTPTTPVS